MHVVEIFRHIEVAEFLFPILAAQLGICEAVVHEVLRLHQCKVVHKGVESVGGDVAGSGYVGNPTVPDGRNHSVGLLVVFLADLILDIHLAG